MAARSYSLGRGCSLVTSPAESADIMLTKMKRREHPVSGEELLPAEFANDADGDLREVESEVGQIDVAGEGAESSASGPIQRVRERILARIRHQATARS